MSFNMFQKFNALFKQHLLFEQAEQQLSHFLDWTPDQFTINNLETLSFFRNLNDLMETFDSNADLAWQVFRVLEIAVQNPSTRQYLIDTVRIITGISNFTVKVSTNMTQPNLIRLWTFIENISRNIIIESEEPYLTILIEHLVNSIMDEKLKNRTLPASILTNLCFKNEKAVMCLTRLVKTKPLLKCIHSIRVLWCKMAIAIARFDCSFLESELITNLKFVFENEYFSGLIRSKDQQLLNHILELLEVELQGDHSKNILHDFDFTKPMESVLTFFDSKMDVGDENEEDNSEYINLFLGMINAVLAVSNVSLKSNIPRIYALAIDNIGNDKISPTALKCVRLIIDTNLMPVNASQLVTLLTRLMNDLGIHHQNPLIASEIYQLLSTVLDKCENVITQIPQDILSRSTNEEDWSFKLTNDNLPMQLYRLQWYIEYSSRYEILLPKLSNLMLNKEVQLIFANGLHNSDQELCSLTMTFIQSKYFPKKSVSKLLSNVVSLTSTSSKISRSSCECKSKTENARPIYVPLSLEKRIDVAVEHVLTKMTNSNSSLEKTELRDLLEYQSIIASAKERLLQSQLKTSSDIITNQANEIGGLKSVLRVYQNDISDVEFRLENYKITDEKMKAAYQLQRTKYENKLTEMANLKAAYQLQTTKYENKLTEMANLQTTYNISLEQKDKELNSIVKGYEKQLSQYKNDMDTYSKKAMQLKKDFNDKLSENADQISRCQEEIVKKDSMLDQKEKLLAKTSEELIEYKTKLESIMSVLKTK